MKRSTGHIYWRLLVVLGGFSILFAAVCSLYLLPMMEARLAALAGHGGHPTTQEARSIRILSAYARLLLAVLLAVLIVGLTLVLRMSRLFFPRPTSPHPPTRQFDAWKEAGKRLDVDEDTDDDADDDQS